MLLLHSPTQDWYMITHKTGYHDSFGLTNLEKITNLCFLPYKSGLYYFKSSEWQIPGLHCDVPWGTTREWADKINKMDKWGGSYSGISLLSYASFVFFAGEGWKEDSSSPHGGGLIAPRVYEKEIFHSEASVMLPSTLTLKQQNTDGRTICAKCGGPIKTLLGFGQNYNHCPVCEE